MRLEPQTSSLKVNILARLHFSSSNLLVCHALFLKISSLHHPQLAICWSSSSSSFSHFCWWIDQGFNWTSSMKVVAARMIFHLLSLPNRQIYAHVLIYMELSVSSLHNGVKIFLMRNDAGIVTFSCNNKGKKIFFKTFFFLPPYFNPL